MCACSRLPSTYLPVLLRNNRLDRGKAGDACRSGHGVDERAPPVRAEVDAESFFAAAGQMQQQDNVHTERHLLPTGACGEPLVVRARPLVLADEFGVLHPSERRGERVALCVWGGVGWGGGGGGEGQPSEQKASTQEAHRTRATFVLKQPRLYTLRTLG